MPPIENGLSGRQDGFAESSSKRPNAAAYPDCFWVRNLQQKQRRGAQAAWRKVLNWETRDPLDYNKEELLNPWFVVE